MSEKVVCSSRKHPCAVCGRTKDGDCRHLIESGRWLCHHNTDHRPGAVIQGQDGVFWAFTGVTADQRCGVFKIDEPLPVPARLPAPIKRGGESWWHYSGTQRVQRLQDGTSKRFLPEHLTGSRWKSGAGPDPWPFYGKLPATPGAVIELEGEKCVDIILSLGYAAITHPGHNHTAEANQARYAHIKDRITHVIYVADNDEPGKRKASVCEQAARAAGVPFTTLYAEQLWPGIVETGSVDDVDPSLIMPAITGALTKPRQPASTATPAFDQARIKLKQHIADGLSGSALATKVLELASEYDCQAASLFRVAHELQSEDDADIQADVELEGIREAARLEQERKEFTLELLLPHKCVEPLRYLSTSLQADDLATAMIFLTTMTGTLKAGTRIWGDEISFAERPQLWLALIGKSGLGKSPAIRNLGLALAIPVAQAYQHRNVDRYQQWEVANAGVAKNQRTPEPEPFVFQVSNYTAGAIVKQFATNEAERLGMLMAVDELAALFSSLNEFQDKAKGSEEQQLLSMFDNNGDNQIRVKDGYRHYSEAQLSIIGGIQPLVFDQLASRGDPAGLFARLLLLPLPTDYRGDNKPGNSSLLMTIAMQQQLEAVMLSASALPHARYSLAPDAMQQFSILKKEAFNLASAAVLPAHSNIYGKRAGYILRMAGALHIVKVACGDVPQDALIPLSTLLLARDIIAHLQQYAITAQSRAAQAAEGSITELMRWIHKFALDKPSSAGRFRADALTPKKRKQYSLQTITAYVQKLVDAGFAEWLPGGSHNGSRQFICKGRLPG